MDSLKFLNDNNRIRVFGFVIMPNHIHLIWEILNPHQLANVQRDFLKYTAQQLKFALQKESSKALELFTVNTSDR